MSKTFHFDFNKNIGIIFDGNRVEEVTPGSQAEEYGVQKGWIVSSINEVSYENMTVKNAIAQAKKENKPLSIVFTWKKIKNAVEDSQLEIEIQDVSQLRLSTSVSCTETTKMITFPAGPIKWGFTNVNRIIQKV